MKQSASAVQPVEQAASTAEQGVPTVQPTAEKKPEQATETVTSAAAREQVASVLPKAVKTPEEQKEADDLAKQAAFRAALAAATHPNRHFIR